MRMVSRQSLSIHAPKLYSGRLVSVGDQVFQAETLSCIRYAISASSPRPTVTCRRYGRPAAPKLGDPA
jgi:hypothetical protein